MADFVNVISLEVSVRPLGTPPHDFCCLSQDGLASVLLLTGQKWVNVIIWPLHWRNPSPAQQQGNVLLSNPRGTLPLPPSLQFFSVFGSRLLSLIFLFSQLNSQSARFLWQPAAHHCPSSHVLTHACTSISLCIRNNFQPAFYAIHACLCITYISHSSCYLHEDSQ